MKTGPELTAEILDHVIYATKVMAIRVYGPAATREQEDEIQEMLLNAVVGAVDHVAAMFEPFRNV